MGTFAALPRAPGPRRRSRLPDIPAIVGGIHEAFSIALASAFWVGIAGAVAAAVIVLLLREEPMRQTFEYVDTD